MYGFVIKMNILCVIWSFIENVYFIWFFFKKLYLRVLKELFEFVKLLIYYFGNSQICTFVEIVKYHVFLWKLSNCNKLICFILEMDEKYQMFYSCNGWNEFVLFWKLLNVLYFSGNCQISCTVFEGRSTKIADAIFWKNEFLYCTN